MLQENIQHIGGLHLQGTGVLAGMAAEEILLPGVCVIDAPLLIEAGVNKLCDRVLVVYADREIRAERIAKRDGIDMDSALLRINSQKSYEFYSENSDFFITNNLCIKELGLSVDSFLRCEGLIK